MTFTFVVPGPIVGKNEARGINYARRVMYTPAPMKLWMRKVAICAYAAALDANWPNPFLVKQASLTIERYNLGGDFDRGNTYLQDALQYTRWWTPKGEHPIPTPFGIIDNDRGLWLASSPPTELDTGGPRLVVTARLHALRSPIEAKTLQARWFTNETKRIAKRREKSRAKRKAKSV